MQNSSTTHSVHCLCQDHFCHTKLDAFIQTYNQVLSYGSGCVWRNHSTYQNSDLSIVSFKYVTESPITVSVFRPRVDSNIFNHCDLKYAGRMPISLVLVPRISAIFSCSSLSLSCTNCCSKIKVECSVCC